MDDTRPTNVGAVIHGVDVAGFNGGIVPEDAVLENFHKNNPNTPIVLTEEPHTFQTHPGLEGKVIPVVAYTNADEVELFQVGKSLGRKPKSALFECVWQVTYRSGELKAIAFRLERQLQKPANELPEHLQN